MLNFQINKSFWGKASILLFALVLLFSVTESDAQSRKSKKDGDQPAFKDQLWYGGGLNLGFGGINGSNSFLFGVSPMVGYKFGEIFSIGPRIGLDYQWQRFQYGSRFVKGNFFNVEPGMFARAKVFRGFFLHSEASISFQQYPVDVIDDKIIKDTERRNNTYLGAGINQGGGAFGYDIYILYNFQLAKDDQSQLGPLSYRIGFTYNF